MPTMTMLEAIREALRSEMARDERVLLLGEDVGTLGGVFRATEGLREEFGAARVVDTPLAEAVIAGASLGLAVSGLVPVAEIQFLGFAFQAFHQIGPQLGRLRYRSSGRFGAQVTIRSPFGGGVRTPELHSDAVEAHFAHGPGVKVVMPATPADAKGLLLASIRDPDPVLFCEPLRGYRLVKGEVPEDDVPVPLGIARTVRDGADVTLIAWSAAVQIVERAAEQLHDEGINAHVLDLRCLVPLDVQAIVDAVEKTGRCVIVHEAPMTAGFGAEVIATIQEHVFYSLETPTVRVTAPDVPYPVGSLEDFYIPDVDAVVDVARHVLAAA